ncbi:MAG: hypothetical protein AAF957_13915 [Planctomycetota bacterium]
MLIPTLLLLGAAQAPAPDDLSHAATAGTIAWVQSTDHVELLELGLEHPLVARVLGHPLVRADLKKKGQDPEAALRAIEAIVGESPLDLATALTSAGVGVGLLPADGDEQRPYVVARGRELDAMEDALETLIEAAAPFGGAGALPNDLRRRLGPKVTDAWRIGKDGAAAALTLGGILYVARSVDDLVEVTGGVGRAIDLRESRRATGLASGTFAWLDLAALEARGDLDDLRKAATDPGMHFVFGPVLTYACTARSLGMAMRIDETGVEVRSRAVGPDVGPGAVTFPTPNEPGPPLPVRSRSEVARAVVHRDVATLLAERTELFSPRKQPGLAEGLANFALLVGGADAVDELFGSFEPRMLFLAETIPFPKEAMPDVALPAACWVARVQDPAVNGPRVTAAFQSLIALTNVQRAQNGEPGLVLGLELVEGRTMTIANLPPPPAEETVDLSYNLAPGCAIVDDAVVLGTHHELVRRVAQRLARERTAPDRARLVDVLRVKTSALRDLIVDNRDLIVMQSVLNEGKTESRASLEVDLLLDIVSAVDTIEFATTGGPDENGVLEATLRVDRTR